MDTEELSRTCARMPRHPRPGATIPLQCQSIRVPLVSQLGRIAVVSLQVGQAGIENAVSDEFNIIHNL